MRVIALIVCCPRQLPSLSSLVSQLDRDGPCVSTIVRAVLTYYGMNVYVIMDEYEIIVDRK